MKQKDPPFPLDGLGFFTNQVSRFGNQILALRDLSDRVWHDTKGAHWTIRAILTAPFFVVALLSSCLLALPVMALFLAASYIDLSYLDFKFWLKLNVYLIAGGLFLGILWMFATSGLLGFIMAAVVFMAVCNRLKS